jgi:hypothetical protein
MVDWNGTEWELKVPVPGHGSGKARLIVPFPGIFMDPPVWVVSAAPLPVVE